MMSSLVFRRHFASSRVLKLNDLRKMRETINSENAIVFTNLYNQQKEMNESLKKEVFEAKSKLEKQYVEIIAHISLFCCMGAAIGKIMTL